MTPKNASGKHYIVFTISLSFTVVVGKAFLDTTKRERARDYTYSVIRQESALIILTREPNALFKRSPINAILSRLTRLINPPRALTPPKTHKF